MTSSTPYSTAAADDLTQAVATGEWDEAIECNQAPALSCQHHDSGGRFKTQPTRF